MYPNTQMPNTFIIGYKMKNSWDNFSSVLFTLFCMMNVCSRPLVLSFLQLLFQLQFLSLGKEPVRIQDTLQLLRSLGSSWKKFFWSTLLRYRLVLSRKIFIWKPYNDSILLMIFINEEPPKILQDPVPTIATGNLTGTLPEDIRVPHQSALEKDKETIPSQQRSGINKANPPVTAALVRPPPGKTKSEKTVSPDLGMNGLHHSMKLAKLMETLSRQRTIPNLETPAPRNVTFNSTLPNINKIV